MGLDKREKVAYTNKIRGVIGFFRRNAGGFVSVAAIIAVYAVIGCPFRWGLGLCCPACGMTRAVTRACMLDFHGAFHFHPLFPLVPVAAVVYGFRRKIPKRVLYVLAVVLVVVFLAVYAARMTDAKYIEVVYFDFHRSALYEIYKLIQKLGGS